MIKKKKKNESGAKFANLSTQANSQTSKIFQTNQEKLVSKWGALNISPFEVTPHEDAGPALPSLRLRCSCGSGSCTIAPAYLTDVQ